MNLPMLPKSKLWREMVPNATNQLGVKRSEVPGKVTSKDLLMIPSGGVTLNGLKNNVAVGILFIQSWILNAEGKLLQTKFIRRSIKLFSL